MADSCLSAIGTNIVRQKLPPLLQRWNQIKTKDVPALNQQLKNANLPEIKLESAITAATAVVSSKDED